VLDPDYGKAITSYIVFADRSVLLGNFRSRQYCELNRISPGIVGCSFDPILDRWVNDLSDGRWFARCDSRTPLQRAIGKQLDTLVDLCCFGWVPMLILGLLGYQQLLDYLIMVFYLICAVLRLAVFNCIGLQRVNDRRYFVGLPITSMALILPIGLLVGRLIPMMGLVLLTAIGMIAPLPVPKLAGRALVGAIGGLVIVALIYLLT
jgi:CDP-diacylglycerol---serine O-phosphatidyltransferase